MPYNGYLSKDPTIFSKDPTIREKTQKERWIKIFESTIYHNRPYKIIRTY